MTRWNCKAHCKKYNYCEELDNCIVAKEMKRIEKPRRKGRIDLVYEADMGGIGEAKYENCVYGTHKGE